MMPPALVRILVGVIVDRRKARSPWLDYLWRPVAVLPGSPDAVSWTPIGTNAATALFYAGAAAVELHPAETARYRANLASGAPLLWVILRPTGSDPPYQILAVTADPAEGEACTDAGNDLVETVPMPPAIAEIVADFIARHHIERPFVKRRRERTGAGDHGENEE
jgi:hypothetical protein